MKYKKLFTDLRQLTITHPDLDLKQYKIICAVIWSNMSPTEKELFDMYYRAATQNLTRQLSLRQNLKVIHERYNP